MYKLLWQSLLVSPALFGLALAANAAENSVSSEYNQQEITDTEVSPELNFAASEETSIAQSDTSEMIEQINEYSGDRNALDQVTSVNQLSDIDPFWFSAVQKMVDKYGCIVGYPDGTFKGQRNITRYEFAAAVSRCMEWVEENIGSVDGTDLATLRRLVEEFETELAVLGARVDDLEGRVAFVEDNQFSTTTKLSGEVIMQVSDEFGGTADNNTVFQDRVRLTLNTSFTGQDTLVTRLAAGNGSAYGVDGSSEGTLSVATFVPGGGGNNVQMDWLAYYFPFGQSQVYIAGFNGIHSDYVNTINPYFEDYDGGNGALTAFASESPIYRIGFGSGAGVNFGVGPATLTLGYLAAEGESPGLGQGLFNGDYAGLAQLDFNLGDKLGIGVTYVNSYNASGGIFSGVTGSFGANNPAGSLVGTTFSSSPAVVNAYGVEAAFQLADTISISGYGMYADVIDVLNAAGDNEVWSYGGGIAFADLGKEGNLLGIFAGAQPYAGSLNATVTSNDIPLHVEGFYKYQVNDNISITPGVVWVTNPNQSEANSDLFIGTLRTTFTF
ncbi:MAG: iron uptake porin [Spirulinaceae cyanobacterium]